VNYMHLVDYGRAMILSEDADRVEDLSTSSHSLSLSYPPLPIQQTHLFNSSNVLYNMQNNNDDDDANTHKSNSSRNSKSHNSLNNQNPPKSLNGAGSDQRTARRMRVLAREYFRGAESTLPTHQDTKDKMYACQERINQGKIVVVATRLLSIAINSLLILYIIYCDGFLVLFIIFLNIIFIFFSLFGTDVQLMRSR
jgi:hypothetical protein